MRTSWLDWARIGKSNRPIKTSVTKRAAYGDVVNAGISSMAMGSPFAPRLYSTGTNRLKPTDQIQNETRNSAIAGPVGLALGYGTPKVAPYLWRLLAHPSAANRWFINNLLHLPKPIASKVLKWGPLASSGSLAARIADGTLGITQTDKMLDSPGAQGVKDSVKDWVIPAGQLGNVPGAIGYLIGNGMADSAFRPLIRRSTSSMVRPEVIGKFMDKLSKTDPKGYAAMMLAGLSMGESKAEDKIKRIALPGKIVYDQLRKRYHQLPATDLKGLQDSFDKARESFRGAIAKGLEESDSSIARYIGDKFNKYPNYFNGLLDRMQSGDYAQSWSSRISNQPFFAASAAMEGIRNSANQYIVNYVADKLDTNPELIDVLGRDIIGAGRAANKGRKLLMENISDKQKDKQVQPIQSQSVQPTLPQEVINQVGK